MPMLRMPQDILSMIECSAAISNVHMMARRPKQFMRGDVAATHCPHCVLLPCPNNFSVDMNPDGPH
jgi:hypothetical protein